MMIEEILKRENGSSVKITVSFSDSRYRGGSEYSFRVEHRGKRKRLWLSVIDINCYYYRRKDMDEREEFRISECMKLITEDELLSAKLKLWESMKPC